MSNTPTLNETLKLLTKGGPHHPKLVDAIYEVYDLVDSLQQQVAQLQEMDELHTSGAKQLVQDLHTLRVDRDKLQEALEQVQCHLHSEQYMTAESIVDAALGRE
ncbi:hypothetical protein T3H97_16445 [Paenibacillus sp. LX16]|uniref:hypothetical protein n=1 Tax=Paenibacillus sp. LX16 TaxID=1740264 RepID=UPI002E2E1BFD|nr:hypothetical protein [Paenibacillus sp. LX16]